MSGVYYNEYDKDKAAWLRELMARDLIAPGEVDDRSILDVRPDELSGFTQVHLFAGLGGWSYACRLAGVPDDYPVWTASCPCPPFSSAGKKKPCPECGGSNPVPCPRRTGFFICCLCAHAWPADERHLWPEVWRLVRDCRPGRVFGEQVASNDGLVWLGSVSASLDLLRYSTDGSDLPAAGVGSPQIRQRIWWHATTEFVGHALGEGLEGHRRDGDDRGEPGRERAEQGRPATAASPHGLVADADLAGRRAGAGDGPGEAGPRREDRDNPDRRGEHGGLADAGRRGAAQGFWGDADWLRCRDGRWRAVAPGTFPLAHGIPARMVRLRGYGDSISPQVAALWIEACLA